MDPIQEFELAEIKRHSIINETIALGDSRVQRFYNDAVVFVTGGTGFLGKQLIEKLIRSCNIKKIYLLMRHKKKKTTEERIKRLFEDSVFDTLRVKQPDFGEKLFVVVGDVCQPGLGIDPEVLKMVTGEVTHIFHGAATINFTEPLKYAAMTNVHGTLEILKLGKACPHLKSFVHISTAYSHATSQRVKQTVMEQFYEVPIQPNELMKLLHQLDENKIDAMTPELIKNWPNTYSFTKAIAEEAVRIESGNLPICIVRPAIVIGALREPSPGWIDKSCVFGPSGFTLGVGLGVLHTLYRDKNIHLDIVPVDLVNNAIIAAACHTAVRRERGETDIKIYTVTGTRNPLMFGEMSSVIRYDLVHMASPKTVYAGCCLETNQKWLFLLATFIFHYIPAYLVDFILVMLGKKPLLIKVYDLVYKLNGVLGFYMTNDWLFSDSNLVNLYQSLSSADRIVYNSDVSVIGWKNYIKIWGLGIRKHIMKDGLAGTKTGIRKLQLLTLTNYFVVALYFYGLFKLILFLCRTTVSLLTLFF